jgi:hypothetical protein
MVKSTCAKSAQAEQWQKKQCAKSAHCKANYPEFPDSSKKELYDK